MAGAFSYKAVDSMIEYFFTRAASRTPFDSNSEEWPQHLYLGLCVAVDETGNTEEGGQIVVPGTSAGGEPDFSLANINNGYSRLDVGPDTDNWQLKAGSYGILENKVEFSFTHTPAAGSVTCGGTLAQASLAWGYCNNGVWTPLMLKQFFITESPTSGERSTPVNVICYGDLTYEKPVYPGDTLTFAVGALTINLTTCV